MDRQIQRLGIVNRGEPAMRALTAVAELNQEPAGAPPITHRRALHRSGRRRLVRAGGRRGGAARDRRPSSTRPTARADRATSTRRRWSAALRGADVDAVWVGWGFVAERASFAQRCEEAGIIFVGPDSATIRLLGDKVAAKRVAEQAGVPVVPWSGGPVDDVEQAAEHAARLGYPVVLKAAAGRRRARASGSSATDDELAAALAVGARRGASSPSATRRSSWSSWSRPRATSRCR